jgi:tRNA/tmRNA/rRNA uracil-C5-methylase (TrmA/RlmC/RlmD family)
MDKLNIFCPCFSSFSGCSVDFDVTQIKTFAEAKLFFADLGIPDFKLITGNASGCRCRAKLAVRGTKEEPLIGLFQTGSHQVINIPQCRVHHPLINQAVAYLREWIKSFGVIPYDEKTGKGVLRYVEMAVDRENQSVQLVLVLNQRQDESLSLTGQRDALKCLWEAHPTFWHSLWLNFNKRRDNIILGDLWEHLYGEKWLWDRFCGRQVCFHPASFSQANPEMFEKLLVELAKNVPRGTNLVEFYAGGGVIGLTLAEKCQRISLNEIVPLAQVCFEESCKRLPADLKSKLTFVCGSADHQLALLRDDVDVVIVDPPRKGIDELLLSRLCAKSNLKRLIYVSCGWKSFKKNCIRLLKSEWKLTSAKSFLFFPGSDHLEILAVFDKKVS